jgi:hypothetical protein
MRLLTPTVMLFLIGCGASQKYSQPGVHQYSDLHAQREQRPAEETRPVDDDEDETRPGSHGGQNAADPLRQRCRDTRDAREKDRLQAQKALDQYHADQDRVMAWYQQHCHLGEITVTRKVGESFESKPEPQIKCDTEVGRPQGLTVEFVADHQAAITTPDNFYNQDLRELHYACVPYDKEDQAR